MKAFIVSACRSPFGKFGGALARTPIVDFSNQVVKSLLKRGKIDGEKIDSFYVGQALQAGSQQAIARHITFCANVSQSVSAMAVNTACASGLSAVQLAVNDICLGHANIAIAGGIESMSTAPYLLKDYRFGKRYGESSVLDAILHDGLIDAVDNVHMAETVEHLAKIYNIDRTAQDDYSLQSHMRVVNSINEGYFIDEITDINLNHLDEQEVFKQDECYRTDCSIERLRRLPSVFVDNGTITAGNASSLSDGAAFICIASDNAVKRNNFVPIAQICSIVSVGIDHQLMGMSPVVAINKLLKQTNLDIKDIGLFEINEAFAAQVLAVQKALNIPMEKLNIHGGAIALGHPLGASGTRIIITLANGLKHIGGGYGIAAICAGGGLGVAALIKV